MNFKEKITEMVENVYDLARDGKYDVKVDLIPRKKGNIKSRQNYCLLRCFYFSNSMPKTVKCPLPTNLITNWAKWLGVISVSLVIHQ